MRLKRWSALLIALVFAAPLPGTVPARAAVAPPTIVVAPGTLTPYHSGGCWNPGRYPCYTVSGTAEPGAKVTVTVTDDPATGHAVTASTFAAEEADPGAGVRPGDWRLVAPSVTDLGGHGTAPSTLVFSAVATVGSDVSPPTVVTATKTAVTPGDATSPRTTVNKSPPTVWSRTCPMACGGETISCAVTPGPVNPDDPGRALPRGCSGNTPLTGRVEDDIPGARGIASEVADITITIVRSADQYPWAEYHVFTRRGTQAFFGIELHISDFEPNTSYDWIINATDAAGNEAEGTGGSFFVAVF